MSNASEPVEAAYFERSLHGLARHLVRKGWVGGVHPGVDSGLAKSTQTAYERPPAGEHVVVQYERPVKPAPASLPEDRVLRRNPPRGR